MKDIELLQKIGLTKSESKVYLALLKIGEFTSKGRILKEAKIAPSKIYHVLNKLMDKGLASTIIKNNVKHFAAAPPSRVQDYLENKRQQVVEQEQSAQLLLPQLEKAYQSFHEDTTAEIFRGWKGMETAYSAVIESSKPGQTAYVLGASEGVEPEKTSKFFRKYGFKSLKKGLNIKVIYNENSRGYAKKLEKDAGIKFNKKFLFKTSPVEVTVTENVTAIVMLKKEPLVILIYDKKTAENFIVYFKELWKIAKK